VTHIQILKKSVLPGSVKNYEMMFLLPLTKCWHSTGIVHGHLHRWTL